jgi:sugar lactone lactonase YvrE
VGLDFDAGGRLWVCDYGNHRIRTVNLQTEKVSTVKTWAIFRDETGTFLAEKTIDHPDYLTHDERGNVYVSEYANGSSGSGKVCRLR